MQNIRNLKDPTTKQHTTTCCCCCHNIATQRRCLLQLLLIVFGFVMLQSATIAAAAAAASNNNNSWMQQQQQEQQQIKNVSCIEHYGKFTCNCQNVNEPMQLPHLKGSAFHIEISNCKSLTIDANMLEETIGLRRINFLKIDNLVLNKNALTFKRFASNTPLIVEFEKVNFELIDSHAINGNIEEVSFIDGRIDVINSFGFATVKDRAILFKMDKMHIKRIEPMAFKKFAVEQMEITNCNFETSVPSKAFYELEVLNSLSLNNNRFQSAVHSRSFSFKMISRLSIANNQFASVDGEWIEAFISENIVIRENNFGNCSQIAFRGVQVHRNYISSERLELRFINNTVRFANEPARGLEFNQRFALGIKQLRYDNVYACRELDRTQKPAQPKVAFFQAHSDNIYFRRGSNDDDDVGAYSSGSIHASDDNNQSFVVLSKIIESDCQQSSYLLFIIIGSIALILILIFIALIVWWRIAKKRKRRKMDVIQPEPRTYKETQIVYQIENAGLLKTDF